MKKFDEEYQIYRKEHQAKFNEDFDDWRSSRNGKDSQSAPPQRPPAARRDQGPKNAHRNQIRNPLAVEISRDRSTDYLTD
jgi:hypothetical protein